MGQILAVLRGQYSRPTVTHDAARSKSLKCILASAASTSRRGKSARSGRGQVSDQCEAISPTRCRQSGSLSKWLQRREARGVVTVATQAAGSARRITSSTRERTACGNSGNQRRGVMHAGDNNGSTRPTPGAGGSENAATDGATSHHGCDHVSTEYTRRQRCALPIFLTSRPKPGHLYTSLRGWPGARWIASCALRRRAELYLSSQRCLRSYGRTVAARARTGTFGTRRWACV